MNHWWIYAPFILLLPFWLLIATTSPLTESQKIKPFYLGLYLYLYFMLWASIGTYLIPNKLLELKLIENTLSIRCLMVSFIFLISQASVWILEILYHRAKGTDQ